MSYTTSGISIVSSREYDLGRIITARTTHTDKLLQCYVSGALVGWQRPQGGTVQFVLTEPRSTDIVLLLAVDEAEAGTDFWVDAFGVGPADGNRIDVQTPQVLAGYVPGDVWKVYRGEAGDAHATILAHRQDFYTGGRHSGGWGKNWGYGGWGFNGQDCRGWGYNWGYGEWGFGCDMLQWISEPLPPGRYPIKVLVEDEHGNASDAYETTVALVTYPRPASDLTVTSYNPATDTLVLSFSDSEDLNS